MPINIDEKVNFNKAPRTEQYYDQSIPSLKIYAQPLDMPIDKSAYIKATLNKQKNAEAWQSLASLATAGVSIYQKIQAENARKEELKGWLKAASGGQLDDKASESMANGYYKYTAMLDYATYNSELQKFYLTNKSKWKSPEELKQAIDTFNSKWLDARPTNDTYLENFLPKALETQKALIDAWTQEKNKELQEDIYATALAGVQQHADTALNTAAKQFLGVANIEALGSTEYTLNGIQSTDIHNFIRWNLTQVQEEAKDLGLSRITASEIFIKRIGDFAVKYGLPELLDFTSLKDSSGIALDQTILSDTIEQYRDQATKVRNAKIEEYNKNMQILNDKKVDLFYKNLYSTITQYNELMKINPAQAKASFADYWEKIQNDPNLTALDKSHFEKVINLANNILYNPNQFASVDNDVAVRDLEIAYYNGSLTPNQLHEALDGGQITLDTFSSLYSKVQAKEDFKNRVSKEQLEAKILAKAKLQGASEDEWNKILEDPAASADLINQYTNILASQQKIMETQAEQQTQAEQANKQKLNYLQIKTRIASGDVPSPDTIYQLAANGELDVNDASSLVTLISSAYNSWDNDIGKRTSTLKKAAITKFAGSSFLPQYKADVEYEMLKYADQLEQDFYSRHKTTEPDLVKVYQEEVLAPLNEYGEQLTSFEAQTDYLNKLGGINSSQTTTVEDQGISDLIDKPKGFISSVTTIMKNVFGKLFGNVELQQGNNTNGVYTSSTAPALSLNKQDAVEYIATATGVSKEEAEAMTYQQAVQYTTNVLRAISNHAEAKAKAVIQLIARGFTEEEANRIVMEAIKNQGPRK